MDPSKPHECPFCGKAYHFMSALAKHVLTVHQQDCFVAGMNGGGLLQGYLLQEPNTNSVRCWCLEWFKINCKRSNYKTVTTSLANHWIKEGGLTQHILDLTFETDDA